MFTDNFEIGFSFGSKETIDEIKVNSKPKGFDWRQILIVAHRYSEKKMYTHKKTDIFTFHYLAFI